MPEHVTNWESDTFAFSSDTGSCPVGGNSQLKPLVFGSHRTSATSRGTDATVRMFICVRGLYSSHLF